MAKLCDLEIDRTDIVATYENGPNDYDLYCQIMALLNKGLSPYRVGKALRNTRDEVSSVYRKAKAYQKGVLPRCMKGVEKLENNGLLPMNLDNPKLPLWNLLVSANFWRGVRSGDSITSSTNYISVINSDHEEAIKQIFDALGLQFKLAKGIGSRPDYVRYPSERGRLMELTGFSTGRKRYNETLIPMCNELAIASLKDLSTDEQEALVAFLMGRDLMSSLLFFRCKFDETTRISLHSFETKKAAQKQTKAITKLGNQVMPGLEFCSGSKPAHHTETGTYFGRITVVGKQATQEAINKAYFKRLEEVVRRSRQSTVDLNA